MEVICILFVGRSFAENVADKFILSVPSTYDLCESVENFASVELGTSEQHIELRPSRISRDVQDVQKILTWFSTCSPFPRTRGIMCIANGIVGDSAVNCYEAFDVGSQILSEVIGGTFQNLKLKRSRRVTSLVSKDSKMKIHNDMVSVDTDLLFQRIICFVKDENELKSCFSYELAPFPTSIFDGSGMRKTQKSALYSCTPFTPCTNDAEEDDPDTPNKSYIVDGGFLLHRVHWPTGGTYQEVVEAYKMYVHRHFTDATVVFDGYDEETSTKKAEQRRRYGGTAEHQEILFQLSMNVTSTREKFLANSNNKSRLIEALKDQFVSAGISVRQAEGDADVLIIRTAIDIATKQPASNVYIVGEDIDLLVILIYHSSLSDVNVKLLKPGKWTQKGKMDDSVYCPKNIRASLPNIENYILFLHAFSG